MSIVLEHSDPIIWRLISQEQQMQSDCIRLIPSENYVSKAVIEASGSCLTNRYAEGYPGKRYYEGQQITDQIETIARQRAKQLFKVDHVNVQPYSGSVANMAAYAALIEPGQTIMGMSLAHGGHLTHGWKVSLTSKFFNAVYYTLDPKTGLIDYDMVESLAKQHRPKLIICGATAYPRIIDFAAFGRIAKEVDAYLVADIAHIAGLIVGGVHPSPVPYADIISTTTHKTLRGPRGGMLMCRAELAQRVDKAVFPGLQGGPHMHTISAIAVALGEAATEDFAAYARRIVKNCKAMAERLLEYGFNLVSGGTDNHLILIDLRNKGIPGKKLARALDRAGIISNYNTVPNDPAPPMNPNGLRIGTPAITTRGMKEEHARQIATWIHRICQDPDNESVIESVRKEVRELCEGFPVPEVFVRPAAKEL